MRERITLKFISVRVEEETSSRKTESRVGRLPVRRSWHVSAGV
jgi:hypothetical protein